MPDPAPLHPDLEPIRFLVGTWRGTGEGAYPTIDSFSYREEVSFGHVGKPFLAYGQKTSHADTGLPLHAEVGYWRLIDGVQLEVVLTQPTGIVESLEAELETSNGKTVIDLRSASMMLTRTAKSVTDVRRRLEIDGDQMHYDVWMAAVGEPLTHHLRADLRRVAGEPTQST